MKAKRIVMAVAMLVLVLAIACALVACDSGDKNQLYSVHLMPNEPTLGEVDGEGDYKKGESVTIHAIANEGCVFDGWYENDKLISTLENYTFNVNDNIKYTAIFSKQQYSVTLECELNHGTVQGSGKYDYGNSATIIAAPNTGYSFVGWYDGENLISTQEEYTIEKITDNVLYNAKFNIKKCKVNIECDPDQGYATGAGEYDYGSRITLKVTANVGYNFNYWECNDAIESGEYEYQIIVTSDEITYTAKFSVGIFYLSLDHDNMFGEVTGTGSYNYGDNVTIKATPKTGYKFAGWYNGANLVSNEAEYNFAMVGRNQTYEARFEYADELAIFNCQPFGDGTFSIMSVKDEFKDLSEIEIPEYVSYFSSDTFAGCVNLVRITIPNTITRFYLDAFADCIKLSEVHYNGTLKEWCARSVSSTSRGSSNKRLYIGGSEITGDLVIPDGVTSIGCYSHCSGITSLTIPDSVTSIDSYALYNCSGLTSVTIGNNVTSIGDYAFESCSSLTSVNIPDSVTSIGNYAFSGCSRLSTIIIPDGVTSVGNSTFRDCSSLTSATIGNGVISISNAVFYDCNNLSTITIPDSVTSIESYAFYNCSSLATVIISDGVTRIGDSAFNDCSSLSSVTIGSSVASIGSYAFDSYHKISEVRYTGDIAGWVAISGLKSLMQYGLDRKLYIGGKEATGELVMPDGVTSIGDYAFYDCYGLTSVIIPDSVTDIGNLAFSRCFALVEVYNLSSLNIKKGASNYGYVAYYAHNVYTSLSEPSKIIEQDGMLLHKDGDNVTLLKYTGSETNVIIPEYITKIVLGAFYGCNNINSITLPFVGEKLGNTRNTYFGYIFGANVYYDNYKYVPTSLKEVIITGGDSIGDYAFDDCYGLTSVTIPDSVTSIGSYAFRNCRGLTSISIPNSVRIIGNDAYSGCSNLTSVTIGNSVTNIGDSAFGNCYALVEVYNLSSLNITKGTTAHGHVARCARDVYTSISEPSKLIKKDGMILHADGNNITLVRYIGDAIDVDLPNYVTTIGNYAFRYCDNLNSVIIGNGVTSIEDGAFYTCRGLTNVTIGNSVASIGENAFYGCRSLTNVTIGNSVTSIGNYAFEDCSSLISVTIPDSVTSIGNYAFYGCKSLTSVTIGNSVTNIGNHAFNGCSSLISVTIPNSVTNIGYSAFSSCSNLTSVRLSNSITSISDSMFSGCNSLTSITIPDSVISIGNYAFNFCNSLTYVIIPNSVTKIGERAFIECRNLVSITIGSGMTSISGGAFLNCYALAEVYNLSSLNITKGSESYGCVAYYALNVYTALTDASKLTENDGMILHTDGNNVTLVRYIGEATSVIIPNYVSSIGNDAFSGCSSLTNVTIPDSVTSIGNRAFYGCSSLTNVTIPDSVTSSIGLDMFRGCGSLISVIIGSGVTSIDSDAFAYCTSLTDVIIGSGVTSIGNDAFLGCSSLANVIFENTSGWHATFSNTDISGIGIEVTNPSQNAIYITEFYRWYRK